MAAHDDDQDLVTIRIPRRAAAMYAAELDVASSPWTVALGIWGQFALAIGATLVGATLLIAGLISCLNNTMDTAAILSAVGLGFTLGGLFFIAAALRYRRALKERMVI